MKPKKQNNYGRGKGKTQISISLPTELVERIDKAANAVNRNRSNFIVVTLSEATK